MEKLFLQQDCICTESFLNPFGWEHLKKSRGPGDASFGRLRRTADVQAFPDHLDAAVASLVRREHVFGRGESVGGSHQGWHVGDCRIRVGGESPVALDDKVVSI